MKITLGRKIKVNLFLAISAAYWALFGDFSLVLYYIPALLLHESAHVIVTKAFGMDIDSIEILPFGANAKVASFTAPGMAKEICCAVSGPAANLAAAAAVYFINRYVAPMALADGFIRANLAIAAINMLPALPLDGGRIIKSILSKTLNPKTATRICAFSGIVFGIIILVGAMLLWMAYSFNQTMFMMGIFLIYAASKELKSAPFQLMRDSNNKKEKMKNNKALLSRGLVVNKNSSILSVMEEMEAGRYNIVYILDDSFNIIGTLSETNVLNAMIKFGSQGNISLAAEKF